MSGREGAEQGAITKCSDFKQVWVYDWAKVRRSIRHGCESPPHRAPGWEQSVRQRVVPLGWYSTEYGAMSNAVFNSSFMFSAVLVAPLPQGPKCRITE